MRLKKILLTIFIIWIIITTIGGIYIQRKVPSRKNKEVPSPENGVRLAFFSDMHMQNSEQEVETDIGAPSSEISKNTKLALNNVNPDYIFSQGDLTAQSEHDEWEGYKRWIEDLEAPVFDVLGNHDREHFPNGWSYGTGYFTQLGRQSGTKVLKLGNNVFILISEEHNPEFNSDGLDGTIPQKRFEFVEKYLKKYSESNNIFIISHTPLSGTTAYSRTWYYGLNKNWLHITNKFMTLLESYDVTAHISGHVHTDYRRRDEPNDHDKTTGVENVGKFVNGKKITNSARLYPPYRLPETYFLNMPAANIGQAWSSRFYFIAFPRGNPTTKTSGEDGNLHLKLQSEYEEIGPPLFDILHSPETSGFLGRGAIYYADFVENRDEIKIITRWASGNKDVENYRIELEHSIELADEEMQFIASDLSLRKKDNLIITRDNWFKIKKKTGFGTFSKKYRKKQNIVGLKIENYNLKSYDVKWKGSKDSGETWQNTWHQNPENMGKVNAVKMKIKFHPEIKETAYIEDIKIKLPS